MAVISGRRKTISSETRKALSIEGIDEIQDNLARVLNATTGKEMKRVMMQGALIARNRIRDLAPLGKTGNLKRGVFAAYGDDNKPSVVVGMNYKIAPHAHWIEFGHAVNTAQPHPYFRPGLVSAAPQMKVVLENGFKQVIENAPQK